MDVEQVRSFNRTVTERIGALQDSYLASDRPLGADRVLWEIGDGTDLRALRNRLNLDSGYLSRLIGSLQREGLVETAPGEDKRVRAVRLTDGRPGRARGPGPLERRARPVAARSAEHGAARAAARRDGHGRAPADRGPRRDRRGGPGERRTPSTACASTTRSSTRASTAASSSGRRLPSDDAAVPRRPPARRARRLRGDQGRRELPQAHVGRPRGPRARPRAAAAAASSSGTRRPGSPAWRPTAT